MSHLLIIGQNPGRMNTTDPRHVPIHAKLYQWMDALGIKYYSFVNVQSWYGHYNPGPNDLEFVRCCIQLHNGGIIVLGNVAWSSLSKIYGMRKLASMAYLCPHPSGRNRKFNDPEFENKMLKHLKFYLRRKGPWDIQNSRR